MATTSTPTQLGSSAPDFSLPDTNGQTVSLGDFAGKKAMLVMFLCNHCPYVVHVADQLASLGRDYQSQDVGIVGINSNDVANYPSDSPEKMKEEVALRGYTFPYLFDETQAVARAYDAVCTPDIFIYDADGKLAYRGQLDDTRPKSGEISTGQDVRAALDALLASQPVSVDQKPATGCGIKWK
jgi:peroxiredoxin